jgi:hypothetical protein
MVTLAIALMDMKEQTVKLIVTNASQALAKTVEVALTK